jgi:hypothetical protein
MNFEKSLNRNPPTDVGPVPLDEGYKGLGGRWCLPDGHGGAQSGGLTADALALPDVIIWGPDRPGPQPPASLSQGLPDMADDDSDEVNNDRLAEDAWIRLLTHYPHLQGWPFSAQVARWALLREAARASGAEGSELIAFVTRGMDH